MLTWSLVSHAPHSQTQLFSLDAHTVETVSVCGVAQELAGGRLVVCSAHKDQHLSFKLAAQGKDREGPVWLNL